MEATVEAFIELQAKCMIHTATISAMLARAKPDSPCQGQQVGHEKSHVTAADGQPRYVQTSTLQNEQHSDVIMNFLTCNCCIVGQWQPELKHLCVLEGDGVIQERKRVHRDDLEARLFAVVLKNSV